MAPKLYNMSDAIDMYTMVPANATDLIAKEEASDIINTFIPPILIVVGVTCNIIIIITMRTKYFRSVSTSVYLRAGALNDSLGLLVSLTAHWVYVSFPDAIVRNDSSHAMCKFFNFYGWGNTDLGILLSCAMTVERAVVIAAPFGAAKYCSVKRARIVVFVVILIVVTKDFHLLFTSDIVPVGRTERLCDVYPPTESYRIFWLDVWPWIHFMFLVICGVAILISNVIIIHNVRKSPADMFTGGQKWRQLVPMLLSESVLLMLLTFPFTIHLAILALNIKSDENVYTDPESQVNEKLVFSITFYMLYSNKCLNFFLYCITGSRFREALRMVMMTCCCRKKSIREGLRSALFQQTISNKAHKIIRTRGSDTGIVSDRRSRHSDTVYTCSEIVVRHSRSHSIRNLDLIEESQETFSTNETPQLRSNPVHVPTVSSQVEAVIAPFCYIDIIYHF